MSKMSPFDFAKAAGHTKQDLFAEDETLVNDYNSYMVNKIFSYFDDTIFHANEMNMRWEIPSEGNFYYYMGALRSRNRYAKWYKPDNIDDIKLIQAQYECSVRVAKQYLDILTKDQVEQIRTMRTIPK